MLLTFGSSWSDGASTMIEKFLASHDGTIEVLLAVSLLGQVSDNDIEYVPVRFSANTNMEASSHFFALALALPYRTIYA